MYILKNLLTFVPNRYNTIYIKEGNAMNLTRAKAEFEKYAKETLELKELGGAVYAFGSELACLRLFYVYRNRDARAVSGFSENLNTWYFRLETL
jgi:hypothetical protein